jgi:hypothetical protein
MDCEVIFAKSSGLINKSWLCNIGVVHSWENRIALIDADILMTQSTFDYGMAMIVNDRYKVYSPYSKFLDLNREASIKFSVDYEMQFGRGSLTDRYGNYKYKIGGAIFFDRDAYMSIGGYDESFEGWGGEDDEFYVRAVRLLKVSKSDRVDDNIYHLWHDRSQITAHEKYSENVAKLRVTETIELSELKNKIAGSWNFIGDLTKYSR